MAKLLSTVEVCVRADECELCEDEYVADNLLRRVDLPNNVVEFTKIITNSKKKLGCGFASWSLW